MCLPVRGWSFVAWSATALSLASAAAAESRQLIHLDGSWQIAEGTLDQVPARFDHTVPVPGLADMARPPFAEVGAKQRDGRREAFWYRRRFRLDGPVPAVARLKIHKAKFGTRVFLNGQLVGDHVASFTPGIFDVKKFLRGDGQTNELVVRVGSSRMSVPRSIPDGWDFEKIRYLPGIYDSVDLILSGNPHIQRVQTVPELEKMAVRVVATLQGAGQAATAVLHCRVLEVSTGRVVGAGETDPVPLAGGAEKDVDLTLPIAGCRLWSPEDPFLYRLEASTTGDTLSTRFGMRTFRFDPRTKQAVLNGKPYPMRGTNVCIYRFFEDPARGDRPWRGEWVRRLHRVFKTMHWNAIRYCIGFPPEQWYDIADEEGLLIQDEFPIWYGGNWCQELTSAELVKEYTEWIQERWNHPCVVIWDGQNESKTDQTGKAIEQVRGLDLSDRPWNNGYGRAGRPGDPFEAHPYPFSTAKAEGDLPQDTWRRVATSFRLADLAKAPAAPGARGRFQGNARPNSGNNPIIINEYGWLWLNRDGAPTTLTKANYQAWLGPDATADERRELYARYLAAMTEHWRSHRQVAAVLHFCGLGYSRPNGQTSDHFIDLEKLTLEPHFARYVGDAFAPVGLMIDYWAEQVPAGAASDLPVVVINDLASAWQGPVRLQISGAQAAVFDQQQPCRVASLGREVVTFKQALPTAPGSYQIVAELALPDGRPVHSRRQVEVLPRVAGVRLPQ